MAAYTRVQKLVNPRPKRVNRKRSTAKSHRRRTPPRNADGSFRKRVVHQKRSSNPKARHTRKRAALSTQNPAYLITLGAANPRKRKHTTVAKKRVNRKRTSNVRSHRRRSNPTRVVVVAPRHNRKRRSSNPRRRYSARNRRRNTRRNPNLFGMNMSGSAMTETVAGVLAGVAATKFIVGYLPASLTGIGGTWGQVLASGVVAFLTGMGAKKLSKGGFGDGVLLGGLAQTGSVAINALSPSLGSQFGLGDLIPGKFTLPENPVLLGRNAQGQLVATPAASGKGTSQPRMQPLGVGMAYSAAY